MREPDGTSSRSGASSSSRCGRPRSSSARSTSAASIRARSARLRARASGPDHQRSGSASRAASDTSGHGSPSARCSSGQPVPQPAGVLGPAQQPEALGAQPVPAARRATRPGPGRSSRLLGEHDRAEPADPAGHARRRRPSPPRRPRSSSVGRGQLGQLPVGRGGQPDPPVLAPGVRSATATASHSWPASGLPAGQLDGGAAGHQVHAAGRAGLRTAARQPLRVGQRDDQRGRPVAGAAVARGARCVRRAAAGAAGRPRRASAPRRRAVPDRSRRSSSVDGRAPSARVSSSSSATTSAAVRAPTSAAPSSSARASRGCSPSRPSAGPRSVTPPSPVSAPSARSTCCPACSGPGRRRVPPAQPGAVRGAPAGQVQREPGQVGGADLRLRDSGGSSSPVRPAAVHPARRLPAGPPGALLGDRRRHPHRDQPGQAAPVVDAGHPGQPGVDDRADPGHGQAGLGDRGGQHDPPAAARAAARRPARRRGSRPCSGARRRASTPDSAAAVRRISATPGRNTSTSPSPSRRAARTARATHASIRSPRTGGRCCVVTGNIRASTTVSTGRPAEQLGEPVGGHGGRGGQQPQVRVAARRGRRAAARAAGRRRGAVRGTRRAAPRARPGQLRVGGQPAQQQPGRHHLDPGALATGGSRRAPRSRRSRRPVRRAAPPSGPRPPGRPAGAARRPAPGPGPVSRGQRQRDQRGLAGARRRDQHRGAVLGQRGGDLVEHGAHRQVGQRVGEQHRRPVCPAPTPFPAAALDEPRASHSRLSGRVAAAAASATMASTDELP